MPQICLLEALALRLQWVTAGDELPGETTQARVLLEKLESDAAGIPSLRAILEAED